MNEGPDGGIKVLHVDDDSAVLDLTATFLERATGTFAVEGVTSAEAALDRLEEATYDCVVSDYEMPGMCGIDFLSSVRERWPDVPFILFTGQGSEDVASAAISAGVTDYMQKEVGTSQYEVLANRIENAVENTRTVDRVERHRRAIQTAREGIAILDEDGRFTFVNRAYADLYGHEPRAMLGEHWEMVYPDEEVDRAREEILPSVERDGQWRGETVGQRADGTTFLEDHSLASTDDGGLVCTVLEADGGGRFGLDPATVLEKAADAIHVVDPDGVIRYANSATCEMTGYDREELEGSPIAMLAVDEEYADHREVVEELVSAWPETESRELAWTMQTASGDERLCDSTVRPVFDGDELQGFVVVAREVADRIEREEMLRAHAEEIERQNQQLETLASVVSHDLRNPLNVATARLEFAREEGGDEHLDDVRDAIERVGEIVEDMLTLVREWETVDEATRVGLGAFVETCWDNVLTGEATVEVDDDVTLLADGRRLQNLLENLLRNAVTHGGDGVAVRVGAVEGGFYVEDDGAGIPADERERVFEAGYSTGEEGTGLGLHIVRAIAGAHGWTVRATEAGSGGARFEVTGVELA